MRKGLRRELDRLRAATNGTFRKSRSGRVGSLAPQRIHLLRAPVHVRR
jgi:hypothetical protein